MPRVCRGFLPLAAFRRDGRKQQLHLRLRFCGAARALPRCTALGAGSRCSAECGALVHCGRGRSAAAGSFRHGGSVEPHVFGHQFLPAGRGDGVDVRAERRGGRTGRTPFLDAVRVFVDEPGPAGGDRLAEPGLDQLQRVLQRRGRIGVGGQRIDALHHRRLVPWLARHHRHPRLGGLPSAIQRARSARRARAGGRRGRGDGHHPLRLEDLAVRRAAHHDHRLRGVPANPSPSLGSPVRHDRGAGVRRRRISTAHGH